MDEDPSNEAYVLSLLEEYDTDETEAMDTEPAPSEGDWRDKYIAWMDRGELPSDRSEARRIARIAKSFALIDGELYKRATSSILQRCVPIPQGRELLRDIHAGVCGHHAVPRTLVGNVFHQGFYWPTAVADASEIVRTCEGCHFYARKSNLPAHVLQTIPVTWPFAVWGMDIVGPLRKAPGGKTHLLVAIDKFSKWVEVRPIMNLWAEQAVTFFTDIVHRFGVPNSIITDNGSQFTGRKFLEFYDKFHIHGLGGRGASTDQWSVGAYQRHDPTRPQAQDFRPTKQVWSKMAPRAASGCVEPHDHPKQCHWVHPVLPGLRRGGYPPQRLGIRVG
jgi:hypothetical protein